VLLENPLQIPLFNTPKNSFEKDSETQSFSNAKSAPNSTYNVKRIFKMIFSNLIQKNLFNREIIFGQREYKIDI